MYGMSWVQFPSGTQNFFLFSTLHIYHFNHLLFIAHKVFTRLRDAVNIVCSLDIMWLRDAIVKSAHKWPSIRKVVGSVPIWNPAFFLCSSLHSYLFIYYKLNLARVYFFSGKTSLWTQTTTCVNRANSKVKFILKIWFNTLVR